MNVETHKFSLLERTSLGNYRTNLNLVCIEITPKKMLATYRYTSVETERKR